MNGVLSLDAATRVRATRALARMRVDREGGEGTYEEMVRTIAEKGAAAAVLHASLERVHQRAERNLQDVLASIAEAMGCQSLDGALASRQPHGETSSHPPASAA